MFEAQDILEPSISENTVDQILAAMRNPPKIARSKWPQLATSFRELIILVHTEHRLSSKNTRTKLDKTLKPLLRDVASLRRRICDEELHWMNKLLSVSALDLHVKSAKSATPPDRYLPPHDILEQTEGPLKDFETLLNHLCDMIERFDRLNPGEYYTWIGSAGSKRELYIRDEIIPHFRKRGGVGPDTIAVRRIADIYEYAFDKSFSVTSLEGKPRYERQRGNLDADGVNVASLARYSGSAIDFSCAVTEILQLKGFIAAHAQDKATIEKKPKEDQRDPAEWRRVSALMVDQMTKAQLINRIGDIWTNDSKRRKTLQRNRKAPV